MLHPPRYSACAWLDTDMDLRPQGEPETSVEIYDGAEITHGLAIRQPFGPGSDVMLAVHAIRETGVITLSIDRVIQLDVSPVRRPLDNAQSGSNRSARQQPDGHAGDESED